MPKEIENCICGAVANIIKEPTEHSYFGVCCSACGLMFTDSFGDVDVVLGWNELMRGMKARQPEADPAADTEGPAFNEEAFEALAAGLLGPELYVLPGITEQIREILIEYIKKQYGPSIHLGRKIMEKMSWWGSHGTMAAAGKAAVLFDLVETIIEKTNR